MPLFALHFFFLSDTSELMKETTTENSSSRSLNYKISVNIYKTAYAAITQGTQKHCTRRFEQTCVSDVFGTSSRVTSYFPRLK